ncbi:MAG: T9SS type A sorting domain-containing protein, partial [candidate division KSB1 bacterium]|nr:T9SS type A sorting domain-containing protein [candidate division KSB1 bacterium]
VANRSDDMIPQSFQLKQNFPNPFNAATQIKFDLPQAGWTELKIYNLLGDEVKTILSEPMNVGSHVIHFSAGELESGIYYYRLRSGKFSAVKKMVLIK